MHVLKYEIHLLLLSVKTFSICCVQVKSFGLMQRCYGQTIPKSQPTFNGTSLTHWEIKIQHLQTGQPHFLYYFKFIARKFF